MTAEREEALEILRAIRISDHAAVRLDEERWKRLEHELTKLGVFYVPRLGIALEEN